VENSGGCAELASRLPRQITLTRADLSLHLKHNSATTSTAPGRLCIWTSMLDARLIFFCLLTDAF
jgi:hypothetical protein